MQRTLQAALDALPAADVEQLFQQLDLDIKVHKNDASEMRKEICKWAKELSLTTLDEIRAYAQKVSKPLENKSVDLHFCTKSDVATSSWTWVVEDFEQSFQSWQTGIWNGLKSSDFMIRNTQWRALVFKGQAPNYVFVGVGIANRNTDEHVISLRVQPLVTPAGITRPLLSIPNYKLPGKHGMGEKLLLDRQLSAFVDSTGALRLSFELEVRFGTRCEQLSTASSATGPTLAAAAGAAGGGGGVLAPAASQAADPAAGERGRPAWLDSLWTNRKPFSDVTLRVDSTAFPAHRCVLSAASGYFHLMLTGPMRESCESDITLKPVNNHLDAASFEELLHFIYTGTCDAAMLDARADALLALADQFDVAGLKSVCENKLLEKATVGNCLDLLGLADTYHAPHMLESLFALVVKNFMDVITTPAYARLAQTHPSLFTRLNLAACDQRGPRKRKEPSAESSS